MLTMDVARLYGWVRSLMVDERMSVCSNNTVDKNDEVKATNTIRGRVEELLLSTSLHLLLLFDTLSFAHIFIQRSP